MAINRKTGYDSRRYAPGRTRPLDFRRAKDRKLRDDVYERDGSKCVACGSTDRLCVDHIFPRRYGGPNELWNLQLMCWTCNSRKGARTD